LTTFVTVGNATQSFDRLLAGVSEAGPKLPRPVIVQRGVSKFNRPDWLIRDYVPMEEFDRLIRDSTLLIMHAGAGSIIHAVRARKLPVVMPRRARYGEIIDDHQVEFSEALAAARYVALARGPEQLADAIGRALVPATTSVSIGPSLVQHIDRLLAGLAKQLI
jgi:exopolysaccharide biosynthesis glucuronosyltransferase PssE